MLENLKPLYNRTLRPLTGLLMHAGIHPNHVTLTGVAFFAAAGFFASTDRWIAAFIALLCGGVMDGLDGVLAREANLKSVFGAILDSNCDRLTEFFIMLGLTWFFFKNQSSVGVLLGFSAMGGSMMVSYVKARCEGMQVPCKGGILQRPERLILLAIGLLAGPIGMQWILAAITVFAFVTFIQRLFIAAAFCRQPQ